MSRDETTQSKERYEVRSMDTETLAAAYYEDLLQIAHRCVGGERAGHTLQTTALVHEAYLRLARQRGVRWQGRGHFLATATQAMRRVLLDHARRRSAAKRDGAVRVTLGSDAGFAEERTLDLLALDEALARLAVLDARPARVVELRFFAGLEVEEVADALGVSTPTVKRDWRFAKGWLAHELKEKME